MARSSAPTRELACVLGTLVSLSLTFRYSMLLATAAGAHSLIACSTLSVWVRPSWLSVLFKFGSTGVILSGSGGLGGGGICTPPILVGISRIGRACGCTRWGGTICWLAGPGITGRLVLKT